MNRRSFTNAALILGTLTFAAAGCNRHAAGPETQTTTGVQPRTELTTADGCLRAGLAENTFVLTAPDAAPGSETATYQLSPGAQNVNLRDFVGQQVQVSGTLRAEEQVTSSGVNAVGKPKGTSGTPTIETSTELTVKQMTVSAVTPTGQRCAAEPPKADQPDRRIK
jgi:hypothetical protein